jgi:hypothetical protein
MTHRMFAAIAVAVLFVGLLIVPADTSARSGGAVAGRAMSAPRVFQPPVVRPPIQAPAAIGRPVARNLGQVFPRGVGPHHLAGNAFHRSLLRDRTRFGFGYPGWYGTYYDPYGYAGPDNRGLYADPAAEIGTSSIPARVFPAGAYRPGCTTETVTVPAESGGKHAINITRCY